MSICRAAAFRVALAAGLLAAAAVTRAGDATPQARCPVDDKPVTVTEKTPRVAVQGKPQHFCRRECLLAFAEEPERFVRVQGACPVTPARSVNGTKYRVVVNNALWYLCCTGCLDSANQAELILKGLVDPVSGKAIAAGTKLSAREYRGQLYLFESAQTRDAFFQDPARYAILYGK